MGDLPNGAAHLAYDGQTLHAGTGPGRCFQVDARCLNLALDESRYGGAIAVTREPAPWSEDPFARIFPGTVVRTDLFCDVLAPPGPVLERYAGVAWPGGHF